MSEHDDLAAAPEQGLAEAAAAAQAAAGPGDLPDAPGEPQEAYSAAEGARGAAPAAEEPWDDLEDAPSEHEHDGTEADEAEAGLGAPSLESALEALLLVTDEPLDVPTLASLVRRPSIEVEDTLQALAAEYDQQGRGFELREVAGGWRFYTRAACSEVVERYVRDGQQARLTQAALETLAVVAYRQPVSRARISAVRGVNVDGVIRTLTSRGLIAEAGHDATSQAILYRTTDLFLERLGLGSLDELPPLADYLPDIELLDALADEM